MMADKQYQIISQQSFVYLDSGVPINGFLVRARLLKWDELYDLYVPKLNDALIDARLLDVIAVRQKLEELG